MVILWDISDIPLMTNSRFYAGAVGARAASRFGSGSGVIKTMRLLAAPDP
jgi:hypothetical protein